MLLNVYLYGFLLVGGTIFASNLYYSQHNHADLPVIQAAGARAIRYGIPWPMTVLDLHSKYTKGEDWQAIFKPNR